MVEGSLLSCIARPERSNRSAIVDLRRRHSSKRHDGDICTGSLPALRAPLRSPTLGGYIEGPCTRLRHVFGSKGQCWGQISYPRWFKSFATDSVTSICYRTRSLNRDAGVGKFQSDGDYYVKSETSISQPLSCKHSSTTRHVADRPRSNSRLL